MVPPEHDQRPRFDQILDGFELVDIEILEEHRPDLLEKLREVVCEE